MIFRVGRDRLDAKPFAIGDEPIMMDDLFFTLAYPHPSVHSLILQISCP